MTQQAEEILNNIMRLSSGPPLVSIQKHFILIAMEQYAEQRELEAAWDAYRYAKQLSAETQMSEFFLAWYQSRLSGGKEKE
jgi:hypothetical protein